MIDKYTKAALTVIGIALSVIAFRPYLGPATADPGACGTGPRAPCYIEFSTYRPCGGVAEPCYVKIDAPFSLR